MIATTSRGTAAQAFNLDLPLEAARTIPRRFYVDPAVHEAERTAVFGPSWQLVAHLSQLTEPGSFVTADSVFGPVIVVRGRDSTLRAFSNVCRHRAARVETRTCGKAAALQCRYHGWTYDLEGRLRLAPEVVSGDALCQEEKGLPPLDVDVWSSLVFVRRPVPAGAEDGKSLDSFLDAMPAQMKDIVPDDLVWVARREWTLACNWKVFIDNYLDGGYHVNSIHPGLATVLNYAEYRTEAFQRSCLQHSPLAEKPRAGDASEVRKGTAAHYWWVHPNLMLNFYEGVLDTNVVIPLGPGRCKVVFEFFFQKDRVAADREGIEKSIAVSDRIQDEDLSICEDVQRGLESGSWESGRYCPRREAGAHLFHGLLATELGRALTAA